MDSTLKKAEEILNETIKAFKAGDYELGDKLKNIFNDLLENKKAIEKERLTSIYGKNKNFGIIHHIIESNAPELYKTKNGKRVIANYIKLIKENETLKKQFDAYNAICEKKFIGDINEFLKDYIDKVSKISKKTVNENNSILLKFIKDNKINDNIFISEELKNLFESIEYIITNKSNVTNINEIHEAKNVIKDFLNENNTQKNKKENIDDFIKELDEKYMKEDISDSDKIFFGKMLEAVIENNSEKKRKVLNEYKNDLINKLDSLKDETDSDLMRKINIIKEKIDESVKNSNDEVSCLSNLAEINKTINDI